jgi:hypothetical protein
MFAIIKGYNVVITVNIPASKMVKQLKPKTWKGRVGSIATLDRHGSTWSMRLFCGFTVILLLMLHLSM